MSGEAKFIIFIIIATMIGTIGYMLRDEALRDRVVRQLLGLKKPEIVEIGEEKIFSQSDIYFQILQDDMKKMKKNQMILEELKVQRQYIETQKDSIKLYREQIKKYFEDKKEEYAKYDASLAKIYENMEPEQAAEIISRIENKEFVVKILVNMAKENAANVLANMNPDTASELSSLMSNYDSAREVLP